MNVYSKQLGHLHTCIIYTSCYDPYLDGLGTGICVCHNTLCGGSLLIGSFRRDSVDSMNWRYVVLKAR